MTRKQGKKRVLMALSGGIDSAVSAYLALKAGYQVEAAFMKNWSSTAGLKYNECPWLADRQDALRVAAFLRIPLHTLDFEEEYKNKVLEYFFREYEAGRTPNPDVMCNKEIKFKLLYEWAMKNGYDYLATGHYAQIRSKKQAVSGKRKTKNTGAYSLPLTTYQLVRSRDEFKDQTYFIYNIRPEQLPHLLFPIGGMKKSSVRKMAGKIGLPNADKKESMGLCFVGRIRLQDFLNQRLKPKPGPIVDQEGKVIGGHQGLHYYTIGQRQGLKVGATGPYYVVKKDSGANTLHVTNKPDDKALQTREIQLHSVSWVSDPFTENKTRPGVKLAGRFRHQGNLAPLEIVKAGENRFLVNFSKPQKALASGQSLVLYRGKVCVGGGVIA